MATGGDEGMSRREVIDCDRCGARAVERPVLLPFVHTGWLSCPAGGSKEKDGERVDLCPDCAANLLASAVKGMGEDAARKWVADIRAARKAVKPA